MSVSGLILRRNLKSVLTALAVFGALLAAPAKAAQGPLTVSVGPSDDIPQLLKDKRDQLMAHGGTITLQSGNYGVVVIRDIAPEKRLKFVAGEGAEPVFTHLRVLNAGNISFEDLAVVADRLAAEPYEGKYRRFLFHMMNGKDVHIDNMYVASTRDSSRWTKDDWLKLVLNGIWVRNSTGTVVRDSRLENIFDGITDYHGSDNLFENNTIQNFAGDGVRAIGHNGTFRGNLIADCIKINENHDDGIQSWSFGPKGRAGQGELVGLKILKNTIRQVQTPHPLRCAEMHGIGFFDGFWKDLVIEGNDIAIDHWHGIAVFGAKDTVIRNNTVRYAPSGMPNPKHPGSKDTWIKVTTHKDKRPSERVVIEGNRAENYVIWAEDAVMEGNMKPDGSSYGRIRLTPPRSR